MIYMEKALRDNINIIIKKDRVICKATICQDDFYSRDRFHGECNNTNYAISRAFRGGAVTFEGIAVRKEGDEDNVRKAIYIAQTKMERKYYDYLRRHFKKLNKQFKDMAEEFKQFEDKYAQNVNTATDHIKDICDSLESNN